MCAQKAFGVLLIEESLYNSQLTFKKITASIHQDRKAVFFGLDDAFLF